MFLYISVTLEDTHIRQFSFGFMNDFDLLILLSKVLEMEIDRSFLPRKPTSVSTIASIAERSLLTWVSQQPSSAMAYTTLHERLQSRNMKHLAALLKTVVEEKH